MKSKYIKEVSNHLTLFRPFFVQLLRIRRWLLWVKILVSICVFFLLEFSLVFAFQNTLAMSILFLLLLQSHYFLFLGFTRVAVASMHADETTPITPFIFIWFEIVTFYDARQAKTTVAITTAKLKKVGIFCAIMTLRIVCVYLFRISQC